MKKIFTVLMTVLTLVLVGCGTTNNADTKGEKNTETPKTEVESKAEANKSQETIKIASHTNPMIDMLKLIEDDLSKAGYKLEIMEVSDNVQANVALQNKEVDANFFQHEPFMQQYNKGNNANLVKLTPVYNALVAFYSKDYKKLEELPEKAVVAIPNDPTNKARALRLLAKGGLIELKDPNSYEVDIKDITKNSKNLQIKEWGLLNLNEAYQESDLTFNYPTYIEALGLKPEVDGLLLEGESDQVFAITVAAREDNKDSEKLQKLKELMTGEKIKKFIDEKLKGHARVAF
ncbi:MetQ/NlpA family ABC transporter substrate-binding protein [Helcococcus kunzii]|uniref:YaeC family lipoprotein n=1 Tax=Helcococcus kunzii ATCC 51366 TaxID=883114 RepID=H3NNQ5_9FIRM|nr:MetQ/NlpA family ABC transporter substrate-binding protein [Helcococcus kunzii]EHR34030.1 YaeC family lipoprotein [Helcococcus kunzii ATCC 51366]MCT1795638.1 MetQ/NlpA family ABC transporter substrate-binding protein [Helcococcus kunzii]MCT1988796.1 MetQ/NlpA family ABC transporter substrate-binding protein [Helcococcus kunzii]QUY64879.1 hypothetical protein GUI37_04855 [Helcococcus kunzii]QZO75587.1 hypothetical protein HIF96_04690 [Helcococcus kunzii]